MVLVCFQNIIYRWVFCLHQVCEKSREKFFKLKHFELSLEFPISITLTMCFKKLTKSFHHGLCYSLFAETNFLPRSGSNLIIVYIVLDGIKFVWWFNYFPLFLCFFSFHISNYMIIYVISYKLTKNRNSSSEFDARKCWWRFWTLGKNIGNNIQIFIKLQLSLNAKLFQPDSRTVFDCPKRLVSASEW